MDGTLLFREDFGGNNPSDPAVSRTPVSGMSSGYTQIYKLQTSDPGADMSAGSYLVAKRGYRNSSIPTYSVWHIMDDHTSFGDTTRGYLLEIDGRGSGNDVFFSTTISDLCAGSRLTFSAYVANLTTAGQYNAWRDRNYVHPKLSFILTDPTTGIQLARYNTDTISHDWGNYPKSWRETANWQLVGMNFTVPTGVNSIKLSICNNAGGSSTGNDFALDDIEIRLCLPPVTISGKAEACENANTSLIADFTNYGTLTEPLEYKWFYSSDSLTWTELSETSSQLSRIATEQTAGWYQVAVSGAGNITNPNCRSLSEPFRLNVNVCTLPESDLCIDGPLIFREDFGGNNPNDPMVGKNPMTGIYVRYKQDTKYSKELSDWHYIIAKEGYSNNHFWHVMDDHTYPNDKTRGYLFEANSICGTGAKLFIFQKEIKGICAGMELSFSAYVANLVTAEQFIQIRSAPFDGYPKYSYPYLNFFVTNAHTGEQLARYWTDSIGHDWSLYNTPDSWQYSAHWQLKGMKFIVPDGVDKIQLTIINSYTSAYSYTKGNDFALDDIEVHLCSNVEYQTFDTIVCDTILPFTWHGIEWTKADTIGKLFKDITGADSVYAVCTLNTYHCPHPPVSITKDTTICDTLYQVTLHGTTYPIIPTVQYTLTDAYGYDSVYYTWNINTYHCPYPPILVVSDTIVCDTIDAVSWRGKSTELSIEIRDTLFDVYGFDSVYYVLNISIEQCCPDIQILTCDTTICDTLLPFTWIINERKFVFEQVESQEISIPYGKWENCIDSIYILRLDTIHCERLYDIIVNKYNWQLLCNNVRVHELFPNQTPIGYQWYKDGIAIPNATEDDYSEQNELQGIFQLRVTLTNDQTIWSNTLTINAPQQDAPLQKTIYDAYGKSIPEEQINRGIYLIRYEQADAVWIEKIFIP